MMIFRVVVSAVLSFVLPLAYATWFMFTDAKYVLGGAALCFGCMMVCIVVARKNRSLALAFSGVATVSLCVLAELAHWVRASALGSERSFLVFAFGDGQIGTLLTSFLFILAGFVMVTLLQNPEVRSRRAR